MRAKPLVALIVVAVALSGCIGAQDGGSPNSPAADDTDDPATDPGGTSNRSGSSETEDSVVTPAPIGNVTVDWDGSTGRFICVPAGPNTCTGISQGQDDSHEVDAPQPQGARDGWNRTLDGSLEMSWSANDPTTEDLVISLAWTESCGDSCTEFHHVAGNSGTSPVTLDLDGTEIPGDRPLVLSVTPNNDATPDPLYSQVHTDQSFHVDGAINVTAVPGS